MWDLLGEEAAPLMAAARRYGRAVLAADHAHAVPDDRESVGRRLLQLVFGSHGEREVPSAVADLIGDPDSQEALAEVTARADEVFQAGPGTAAEVAGVIAGLYRGQAAAGRVQALVDLGDLLYWDNPQAAGLRIRRRLTPGTCTRCWTWRISCAVSWATRTRRWRPTSGRSAAATLTWPRRRCTSWHGGMSRAGTAMPRGHCSGR